MRFAKRVVWIAAALVLLAAVGYGISRYRRNYSQNRPGVLVPDQGRQHVALDAPFLYNSNPPTSGPHVAIPAEWGVYPVEVHDQILIHNLEHGGILIAYRPGINSEVIAKLEGIAKEFGRKVIMAPRASNDADIALAAWTRLDKFPVSEFTKERVKAFIRAWRNKGPEFVP